MNAVEFSDPRRLRIDAPAVACAVVAGTAVAMRPEIALFAGLVAGSCVALFVVRHPSRLLFLGYLLPMLAFGRAFATVGVDPLYLPDALLVAALLPHLSSHSSRLFVDVPARATGIFALLVALSTVRGVLAGYPTALKGASPVLAASASLVLANWFRDDWPWVTRWMAALPYVATSGLAAAMLVPDLGGATQAASGMAVALGAAVAFGGPKTARTATAQVVALSGLALLALQSKRGPVLTVLLTLCIVWFVSSHRRAGARLATAGMFLVLLLVVSAALATHVEPRSDSPTVLARVENTFSDPGGEASANVELRLGLWNFALRETLGSPVLGAGFSAPFEYSFRGLDLSQRETGAHNSFVGFAYYAGFPAALSLAVIFVSLARSLWHLRGRDPWAGVVLAGLTAVVSTSFTNVALETPFLAGPSFTVVAVGAAIVKRHRDDAAVARPCQPAA